MLKKMMSIVLAGTLCFSMCACGSSSDHDGSDERTGNDRSCYWCDDRISILYSGEPESVWGRDRRSGRIFSGDGRACNVYRNFSDLHWEVADGDYMGTAFYDARQP